MDINFLKKQIFPKKYTFYTMLSQILELDTFELTDTNDMKAIIENLSSKPTYKYFEENRVSYENIPLIFSYIQMAIVIYMSMVT